jgi:DNA repair protein SbcD/Mre11
VITFFHVADTHFGIENYGRIDSATGINSRLLDFNKSLEKCVDLAIKEDIDFFLIAGDAYKTAYPTPTQQKLFAKILFKLYHANIPVVIVVGNHDNPLSFGKTNSLDVFNYLPIKGFKVFAKPESFTLKTKKGPIQIVGIPWPTRNNLITKEEYRLKNNNEITQAISEKVGAIIQKFAQSLDPTLPTILTGHLMVKNGQFSGTEKHSILGNDPTLLVSQLAIKPFDYVALGHLHKHQNINKKGIPVVYSGSIEKIDFGEINDVKGFCKVTINKNKQCKHTFVPLSSRKMIKIELTIKTKQKQTEQIIKKIEQHDINGAIVKIIYHLEENIPDNIDLLEIQRKCFNALCLVNIIPVHKTITRTIRSNIGKAMKFEELLKHYFYKKKSLSISQELLLKRALDLKERLKLIESKNYY